MGQDPDGEAENGKVVSLVARQHERQEEFVAMVDRVTKNLHYAMIPVQTSIDLSRRSCKLPPLE